MTDKPSPLSIAMAAEAIVILCIFIGAAILANGKAIFAAIQSWGGV